MGRLYIEKSYNALVVIRTTSRFRSVPSWFEHMSLRFIHCVKGNPAAAVAALPPVETFPDLGGKVVAKASSTSGRVPGGGFGDNGHFPPMKTFSDQEGML